MSGMWGGFGPTNKAAEGEGLIDCEFVADEHLQSESDVQ